MKKINRKILDNSLFEGISEAHFAKMLHCLDAYEKKYSKNEVIISEGDRIDEVGIVLEGIIIISKIDYHGNETIIAEVQQGEVFAEVFACAKISRSPVLITAIRDSVILFFNYKKIISICSKSCKFHQKLISNMLSIVAHKTLYLNRRVDIISKRTLRSKLLAYFYYESGGLKRFKISLNREELANFLCADRSALSNELSKMQKEGIIKYHKNEFELLQ